MNRLISLYIVVLVLGLTACQESASEDSPLSEPKGKLFIIGGGKRPPSLVQDLIREAALSPADTIAILPMASIEPDSSFYYAGLQFQKEGYTKLRNFYTDQTPLSPNTLEALSRCKLIYIPGGDQLRFMERIADTGIEKAIRNAYRNGSTIAGTSAGAAVMSEKMITGNQMLYAEYSSAPSAIRANNIELKRGLGLLPEAIIDQHFVQRSRYNRILSTVIEQPELLSIGIDESTALCVAQGRAKVYGESQVVVLRNPQQSFAEKDSHLGAENIQLSLYLPGDTFEF